MDHVVHPGDDFYAYANGTWLRRTQIPADRSSWGTGSAVHYKVAQDLRAILDEAAAEPGAPGSVSARVSALYRSALDTATLDRRGLDPLRPVLDSLEQLATVDALLAFEQRHLALLGGGSLLPFSVFADLVRPTKHTLYLEPANLGLPDSPYYTKQDSATVALRAAYQAYLARLLVLSGTPTADADRMAGEQLALESWLAARTRDATASRDIPKLNNPRSVATLTRSHPRVNLAQRMRESGLGADTVVVFMPENLAALDTLLGHTPVPVLRTRLRLSLLRSWAPSLSAPFREAAFAYAGRALRGQPEERPRWQLANDIVDQDVGELLGRLYVERHFSPAAKARVQRMVDEMRAVFRERIGTLAWMSPSTREEALRKVDAVRVQIGYPDRWQDYAGLELQPEDLFENRARARAWRWNRDRGRIGQAVDPDEWSYGSPATVDAWANPILVTMTFPAGILQPPIFDLEADDALNYGSAGATIGHELVHLFDDQGRNFDHTGQLRDWWTPQDAERFTARAKVIVDQFDGFRVLDSVPVNGRLTLGENIADYVGLEVAWEAYQRTPEARANARRDGLTPAERFFLAYAQDWQRLTRDNALRLLVQSDPHAPTNFRVNGPLTHMDAFYATFGVEPGHRMYRAPEQRARIW
jgi:putative endopeptidase